MNAYSFTDYFNNEVLRKRPYLIRLPHFKSTMSLPPDQQETVSAHVRRTTAVSALKRIHRLIEGDKRDELRGLRFAAVLTSLPLGAVGAYLMYAFFRHIRLRIHGAEL